MGRVSTANFNTAIGKATEDLLAQAARNTIDAQFDHDMLVSDIIRRAIAEHIPTERISAWFGKPDGNAIRPRAHSKTAKRVSRLPAGYVPRQTLAKQLGLNPIVIHSRVLAGTITDEVYYNGDWFIRLSS
jgi:hypothetical protein